MSLGLARSTYTSGSQLQPTITLQSGGYTISVDVQLDARTSPSSKSIAKHYSCDLGVESSRGEPLQPRIVLCASAVVPTAALRYGPPVTRRAFSISVFCKQAPLSHTVVLLAGYALQVSSAGESFTSAGLGITISAVRMSLQLGEGVFARVRAATAPCMYVRLYEGIHLFLACKRPMQWQLADIQTGHRLRYAL